MKIEVVGSGSIRHGIGRSKVLEIPPGIYDTDAPDSVLTRKLAQYLIKTTNGHAREYKPAPNGQTSVPQVEDPKTLGQQLKTRRTALAGTTFKRILVKAGKGAAVVFKDILVGVISETAKKLIWPR